MTRTRRAMWTALAVAVFVLALMAAGACGAKDRLDTRRGRGDAPVVQPVDDTAKEVIQFPDRFSNVATACDHHGHRIFVTTKSDNSRFMAVINDEGCRA